MAFLPQFFGSTFELGNSSAGDHDDLFRRHEFRRGKSHPAAAAGDHTNFCHTAHPSVILFFAAAL